MTHFIGGELGARCIHREAVQLCEVGSLGHTRQMEWQTGDPKLDVYRHEIMSRGATTRT